MMLMDKTIIIIRFTVKLYSKKLQYQRDKGKNPEKNIKNYFQKYLAYFFINHFNNPYFSNLSNNGA